MPACRGKVVQGRTAEHQFRDLRVAQSGRIGLIVLWVELRDSPECATHDAPQLLKQAARLFDVGQPQVGSQCLDRSVLEGSVSGVKGEKADPLQQALELHPTPIPPQDTGAKVSGDDGSGHRTGQGLHQLASSRSQINDWPIPASKRLYNVLHLLLMAGQVLREIQPRPRGIERSLGLLKVAAFFENQPTIELVGGSQGLQWDVHQLALDVGVLAQVLDQVAVHVFPQILASYVRGEENRDALADRIGRPTRGAACLRLLDAVAAAYGYLPAQLPVTGRALQDLDQEIEHADAFPGLLRSQPEGQGRVAGDHTDRHEPCFQQHVVCIPIDHRFHAADSLLHGPWKHVQ
ncbi:MAG: hypothetical protein AMJ93_15430 [Anaerolineae bacterium SM23_84]|nr:MAG: hypothetical protein AMJ93_15430 [Anaerolineae bacterium SM23_84]